MVHNPIFRAIRRLKETMVPRPKHAGIVVAFEHRLGMLHPGTRVHDIRKLVGDEHAEFVIGLAGVAG